MLTNKQETSAVSQSLEKVAAPETFHHHFAEHRDPSFTTKTFSTFLPLAKEQFALCPEPCREMRHKILNLLHRCILIMNLVLHALSENGQLF